MKSHMKDLTDPFWIKLKGALFLAVGLLASALLLIDHPDLSTAIYLGVAIWCSCRFYYFAFYVITHYVDPQFKFSGLWAFAKYLLGKR